MTYLISVFSVYTKLETLSKPMQLVVTAVVAFGGAAVIKLVLVYFFGL